MATTAQILATQRPAAAASAGPNTPDTTSLIPSSIVLPHENPEDFARLRTACRAEFQPSGEHENFLVDSMILARWRLARIERLEAEAYEEVLTDPAVPNRTPDGRILAALSGSGNIFDKLQRMASAAERSYHKAHRELELSRTRGQKAQARAIDTYIKQVVFAPAPNEPWTSLAGVGPNFQNEPKSAMPPVNAAVGRNTNRRL